MIVSDIGVQKARGYCMTSWNLWELNQALKEEGRKK